MEKLNEEASTSQRQKSLQFKVEKKCINTFVNLQYFIEQSTHSNK